MAGFHRGNGGRRALAMAGRDSVRAGICGRPTLRLGLQLDGTWHACPIVPPKRLVAAGFYRHVRNPMYVGFAAGWIGLWIIFGHPNSKLIASVAAVAVAVHLFVVFYEEPTLREKFGAEYEEYRRNVSRWRPRLHGWDHPR
jgi:protein-S-isoprenylcysteine O-methyltransferase Ste14